jgi:hypothetical protein
MTMAAPDPMAIDLLRTQITALDRFATELHEKIRALSLKSAEGFEAARQLATGIEDADHQLNSLRVSTTCMLDDFDRLVPQPGNRATTTTKASKGGRA